MHIISLSLSLCNIFLEELSVPPADTKTLLIELCNGLFETDYLIGESTVQSTQGQHLLMQAPQLPRDTVQQCHISLSEHTHRGITKRNDICKSPSNTKLTWAWLGSGLVQHTPRWPAGWPRERQCCKCFALPAPGPAGLGSVRRGTQNGTTHGTTEMRV